MFCHSSQACLVNLRCISTATTSLLLVGDPVVVVIIVADCEVPWRGNLPQLNCVIADEEGEYVCSERTEWRRDHKSDCTFAARVGLDVELDIPGTDIRRRYRHSRITLVRLLLVLTGLRVYDNSAAADPAAGHAPTPILVLHSNEGALSGRLI
jgi:hypothetical protein